ncbi:lipocalin family protein [Comamonas humi]
MKAEDEPQTQTRGNSRLWIPAVLVGLSALATYLVVAGRSGGRQEPALPVVPVADFDVDRFLGDWYEIARIEQGWGRPLIRTRVEYSLADSGALEIVSRGFHPGTNRWAESRGSARFVETPPTGAMKASFFGPFTEDYHVVALDPDYRWAMIMGDAPESFRLLSRSPVLDGDLADMLIDQAVAMGVDADRVHWVMQDGVNPTGGW